MEMTNLRENIVKYRETKDKKILEELYTYFLSYIKNIGKKIYYEYKETDLVTKFIEVINKLDIRESSNDQIQGKIVNSLKKRRADIVKESIKEKVQHPYFLQDLKIDVEEKKDMYLNVLIRDLLDKLSERERMILELSFLEDRTDIYISELLGVSSARIGQIKKFALNKLKKGELHKRRFYDEEGKVEVDQEFTDHGTPNLHSVPHFHKWTWKGKSKKRSKPINFFDDLPDKWPDK